MGAFAPCREGTLSAAITEGMIAEEAARAPMYGPTHDDWLARLSSKLTAQAEYPATGFGHETGCPDTVSAAHIGRTCQEMRYLETAAMRDRLIEHDLKAIPMPPRRVIAVRSNDATNKRNVAALARVGGFAYINQELHL